MSTEYTISSLHEVCEVIQGQSPPGSTYNMEGKGLPFFQGKSEFGEMYPTPVKWCTDPKKIAQPNDILISIRAPVGPTNLCNIEACIGRGLAAIRPKKGIDAKYILYAIRSTVNDLTSKATGSTFDAISGQTLRSHKIPVVPEQEQQRIVAEIEKQFTRLDAGVAALKRVQANLKRYRASVLKAACEGKLVPTEAELARKEGRSYEHASVLLERILKERGERWEKENVGKGKKKYVEPKAPDTSNLPELPEGWCWASAEQINSIITDGEHITPKRSISGVLLLSARNILNGKLALDDVDYVSENEYNRISKRLIINPGDVLLSCSGSVGRSCVTPKNIRFTLVRSVAVLKPVLNMGNYLSIALRSPILQSQIEMNKTQTAQANIFQGRIKTLVFPLPHIVEQKRIETEVERFFSFIEEQEALLDSNSKRAERLRQAVLKKTFLCKNNIYEI